jgi:hypothetical protein
MQILLHLFLIIGKLAYYNVIARFTYRIRVKVVPDHVEITCVRHMFTSPYDSKAMRGLCSNYLTNLHVGEQVKMFVKPSLFKLPGM